MPREKTILGPNEAFILSFLISKRDRKKTESNLNAAGEKFEIKDYPIAPAMLQVFVEVRNIKDAVIILNNS